MTQDKPYKSSRHAALALEDNARERSETARAIHRAFNRPPVTRRPRANPLVRAMRAIWRWL
jgi:hypothetical protein